MNEDILENVWSLFQNIEDTKDDYVVDACVYFVLIHNFDIDVLPDVLRWQVLGKLQDHYSNIFYEDKAKSTNYA